MLKFENIFKWHNTNPFTKILKYLKSHFMFNNNVNFLSKLKAWGTWIITIFTTTRGNINKWLMWTVLSCFFHKTLNISTIRLFSVEQLQQNQRETAETAHLPSSYVQLHFPPLQEIEISTRPIQRTRKSSCTSADIGLFIAPSRRCKQRETKQWNAEFLKFDARPLTHAQACRHRG